MIERTLQVKRVEGIYNDRTETNDHIQNELQSQKIVNKIKKNLVQQNGAR